MTQASDESRALLIKKLLNKAEAKGTTPEERESLNAKATELMVKWGIEDAMLDAVSGNPNPEKIVQTLLRGTAPKSYSYEFATIGTEIANALNCRGFLQTQRDNYVALHVVGHESDVRRVEQLFASLGTQCSIELGTAWSAMYTAGWSGTEKWNWKRSYVRGYALGVRHKFEAIKNQIAKEPGTDLVLVNRVKQVDSFVSDNLQFRTGRGHKYGSGLGAGERAGLRADVGQSSTGGSRKAVQR